ncbi:hypothetical protein B5F88_15765 [Flavonifractor sp. An306]|nr:hypothetical protein B5F88_15765 [Flavonifractor sp. An306]
MDRCAKLSETIYYLPVYTVSYGDIYNWDDRNLRFLKTLQVGEPSGYVSIGNTHEVIRTLILERTTWPLFKECIGATKAEWKHCKLLLEKICGESLYDAIVQKLNCTLDQAKQAVDDFVNRADALIKVGDIDVNVLAEIAKNHDELRELCEKAVSVEWHNSHAAEIAKAEAEVSEMEETISIAKNQHSELLAEIATKQGELDRLLAEIAQYESVGKETLVAVRQKIADAQKDMAGFIADISVFLPQSNATLPYGNPPASWQYSSTSGQYSDEDIELAESWRNEYDAIYQNLSCALGIEPDFCSMLTAFLYATHINNVPTLIAGPGGQDIAEVLSVSMYATGAGQLTLGDECDLSIVERISEADDSIVSVQNMFGKGWTDALPQKFTRLKKQIIWTHPYVEDMLIEPKGLYNYMLPVLSECFIGSLPALETWPSKRAKKFQPYVSEEKQSLRISAFKRLGLSKLLLGQLTRVLSDAKCILENPAKDKDLELLFGVLPLCVLTGRLDVLKDVIRMAVRPNQRIIMLNNGVSGKGFTICCDCGAAMPGDDPAVLKDVLRPYRSKFIKTRCKHSDTINVNLGYDFVTDMLVLEFALDRKQIDIKVTLPLGSRAAMRVGSSPFRRTMASVLIAFETL